MCSDLFSNLLEVSALPDPVDRNQLVTPELRLLKIITNGHEPSASNRLTGMLTRQASFYLNNKHNIQHEDQKL